MATYPIKMLKDEEGKPFVPLVNFDAIKELGGESLLETIENKLEPANLIAGNQIELSVNGNNVTISNSSEGTKLINNLTTTAVGTGALDAAQGKVLKDSIPEVVNNLTTIDSKKALSAHQGYILAGRSIPVGGGNGQVLMKSADDDYSVTWGDAADPNAIVGDGSIKKIIDITYDDYINLEKENKIDPTIEYHINDANDQGGTYITETEIQNMITNSIPTAQDVTSSMTIYDSSRATFGGHSKLFKYGPVYVYQVSFTTASALSANTSYTLATISSEHRPNAENASIQGVIRGNNDTFISFWISGGQIQIYPTTTLASGTNLAGCFSWIRI